MRKYLIAIFMIALTGCTTTAHMYPANDPAAETGVLEAQYVAYGTGHVNVTITMPDGEVLKGEASLVRDGTVGFGSIITTVYGPKGSTTVSGVSMDTSEPGGSPGRGSVFGNRGTYGECEYYNDNWSGHGYGACKISHKGKKDRLYRLQY